MCMEDVRIGNKMYPKMTVLTIGTLAVPAESRRVLVRVAALGDAGTNTSIDGRHTDSSVRLISVKAGVNTIDELSLSVHGSVVKDAMTFVTAGGVGGLLEVLLDDQNDPPKERKF
jgi:hypothetical protein